MRSSRSRGIDNSTLCGMQVLAVDVVSRCAPCVGVSHRRAIICYIPDNQAVLSSFHEIRFIWRLFNVKARNFR